MKKSILLGALAFFAISAMSIQNVNAQVKEEKQETKKAVKMAEKEQAPAATIQEPVKEKKGDCCTEKKDVKKGDCCAEKKDVKKGDCCAEKKDMKKGDCCAEKKDVKHEGEKNVKSDEKNLKLEGKKMKYDGKKDHMHPKHATKPEGQVKKEQKEAGDIQK